MFTIKDIPLHEIVDNQLVPLSDEQRQAMLVSWNEDLIRVENEKIVKLREVRNAKLAETDWTQGRDVTLANDADWQTYRQALRDITDTYTSLDDVVWPEKP
jgi:hypothetical protein